MATFHLPLNRATTFSAFRLLEAGKREGNPKVRMKHLQCGLVKSLATKKSCSLRTCPAKEVKLHTINKDLTIGTVSVLRLKRESRQEFRREKWYR